MTDREHNLASFRNMTVLWFPERRRRGKKYKFSERQISIAIAVLEAKEN